MATPAQQQIEQQMKDLQHEGAKKRGGVEELTPRQRMLDARKIKEKNPNKHYRYVSTSDANKYEARMQDYKKVDEKEAKEAGVRAQVGSMVLVECPREEHEARLAVIARRNRERIQAPKTELRNAVEGIARELRDKHNLDIDTDRLFVNEG